MPHPEHRSVGPRRRAQPDHGRDPDLGPIERPARADQFHTQRPQRLLQSLRRSGCRCRPHSRHDAHRAVSVHSRAGVAQAGRTQSAPEQSSVVSQSEVGDRDWSAAGSSVARSAACARSIQLRYFARASLRLLLPAEGAPLVFATELAHDFVLHVEAKSGPSIDLPAKADPMRGGFSIETQALQSADLDGEVTGILRGSWGFHSLRRTALPAAYFTARAMDCRLQRCQRADRRSRRHAPLAVC